MSTHFSARTRSDQFKQMEKEQYDVLIIGGGITGAGIALDAALRGMKVALVEMQDFAAGTSSRSTKLVHGGLRYLKQFQVGMVAEVGKERAIVYENGPHVTTPEWMMLPMHKGGTFGKNSASLGLFVYDMLAGVKKSERRKMLSAEETANREPLVKKDGLTGGGYYVEYRTDDARLTIEVIKAAAEHGADIINYTKAEDFLYDENKKVSGAVVSDRLTENTYQINARKVVNAGGPWVDQIIKKDYSETNKQLRLTKGVHLVIDQSVFPLRQAIYFDTPDGRMVFAIPRDGKTYVGTTDTFFDQETASPKMTSEDREYILNAIHYMFPDVTVTKEDVESSWAGVRPLIYEKGKDPSEISRKDEIWEGESGLLTMAGGKLTGYRKMAESVVNLIARRFKEDQYKVFSTCGTKKFPISGGDVGGSIGLEPFIAKKAEEATGYGFTYEEGKKLAGMYGSNVDKLFSYAKDYKSEEETKLSLYVYVKLKYAMNDEMTVKPVDFFIRRTGALFFDIQWVRTWKEPVLAYMKSELGWSKEELNTYRNELDKELTDAVIPVDLQTEAQMAKRSS
ncbi:aerobic glycerol-3-phosphate dehydrogenase [Alkalihalophilus pseudofirmus OF4]|uniref:Glycerol-3-phosphate dehydrogenase n=1 Tax=Alkalihalophilus pseudofirmus (strain ATCC BAA-2126 / JCM 17055 / OF4) TaxID=398511 RepID=D3FY79_ALKPO|nr:MULTISPECIES: glycerol-3-phosphate dehydrogenase/oxidase [Alkalihalophilus]ADC49102.1 aerobic glycerol-3-phosphate dehydrogenase [Alkalihalophilus pseudofirmus OF4]MED1600002.1 glycerol-3-phosphate dehydrogenase/oxidase [Alkalihalophilus marmarensis]